MEPSLELPLEIWADKLEEEGQDTSALRAYIALGLLSTGVGYDDGYDDGGYGYGNGYGYDDGYGGYGYGNGYGYDDGYGNGYGYGY